MNWLIAVIHMSFIDRLRLPRTNAIPDPRRRTVPGSGIAVLGVSDVIVTSSSVKDDPARSPANSTDEIPEPNCSSKCSFGTLPGLLPRFELKPDDTEPSRP